MDYLQLILGFALLVAGGEALVRGAVSVASKFGVSPLLIGLTLVGFGTSTPELVTSLQAAWSGFPGIAVGNVVGSNIANVLLILGAAALIAPIAIDPVAFRRDGTALAIATVLAVGVILFGVLDRWLGAVLLGALIVYIGIAYRTDVASPVQDETPDTLAKSASVWPALGLAFGGIAITVLGARLTVDAAVSLALVWGMSETVVGLTVVAVGTSLPELVTSVMAALRRESGLAFGNVIGSNIYNILGIMGVTALVQPIPIPPQIAQFDVWVMAATTVVLILAVIAWRRIGRATGFAFVAAYAAYTGWLIAGI